MPLKSGLECGTYNGSFGSDWNARVHPSRPRAVRKGLQKFGLLHYASRQLEKQTKWKGKGGSEEMIELAAESFF